jgi:hypothetical protein
MSEHIQPAPAPHHAPAAPELPERTPGVAYEKKDMNFRLILWVGFGLIVTAVVIHVLVWGLLVREKRRNAPPSEEESSLAMDEANRPLGKRILDVPPPHLEGIDRESTVLILRIGDEDRSFYVTPKVHVRIGDKKEASLFELREGQTVTITYHMPGGIADGIGVVTSVTTRPVKSEAAGPEMPEATRTLSGVVLKVRPHSVAALREWAEVQMERYGWADRKKDVVRIPVAAAMEEVLKSKAFRPADKKKGDGSLTPPTRSNSGRGMGGRKP